MTTVVDAPLALAAHAKLNLYLHVTGRRADGYHLLDSLVVFAELADTLVLARDDDLTLAVDGEFARAAGPVDDNLAMRAARRLRQACGASAGARMRLTKRIPVAAGLGGGSADAAAALVGLARLWGDDAGRADLHAIALQLGADVPVCLAGRPAFVAGIGERLSAAPVLPEPGLLLVNPGIQLATRDVFGAFRGGLSGPGRFSEAPATVAELAAVLGERSNDLAAAARSLAPQIGDVVDALQALPGCRLARMSGSGPTCFALFDDVASAVEAAGQLTRPAGWWVSTGRLRPSRSP